MKVPCCAIKVGLRSVEARTLTPAAYEYGIRIAENMDLLKIEFEVFEEVQLTKLSDNTDVNKKICDLLEPSWMREQHTNTSLALQNYPMLQHLPEPNREDRFQIGRTERVLLSYVPKFEVIRNGRIQLIVCKASDKLSDCTKTLCKQMKDYIASQQKGEQANRYVPHKGELCVCLGKDDTPMRAECMKIMDGNLARLVYIDYGDQVDVSFNRIFKMTNDLMQLPAFATDCYADDIPANTTYEKISSVLSELDVCEAEIQSFDNERYTIYIPELIARLS
ncbi:hypothetical protein LSTR_LSTR002955 [Laodelphax striatellus]|uniref:Tudor domain-containing protein n=1 Tax=Laodelphax striatellus TaxID=195883 RepID=A0A482XLC7_LAOST|nr:hypothetical protein LSTR_LSTR002955 [Laodelphax striatellus]